MTRDERRRGSGPLVRVPEAALGREIDLGETTVTPAMVARITERELLRPGPNPAALEG